ncbi:YtfJ family protein [Algiphilus sp.]|uniref:YtfJ family protein n=1 Tax=Algiphilus sp. TaxID=1872431 RepID=UPI003B52DAFB
MGAALGISLLRDPSHDLPTLYAPHGVFCADTMRHSERKAAFDASEGMREAGSAHNAPGLRGAGEACGSDARGLCSRLMKTFLFTALLFACSAASAQQRPEVGQPLPAITIDDEGEATIVDDTLRFTTWCSDALKGGWTLLQYLAARPSADRLNRWALDDITAPDKAEALRAFQLYNIININDVTFGATRFALRAIKSNKKKHPDAPMIADRGKGQSFWGLQEGSSAIFLLDEDNRVVFFREGALDRADVDRILDLLAAPTSAR